MCQTCGYILRGKGKFCTGCGAPVTQFSPTALPAYSNSTPAALITMPADPLVLERVLIQKSLTKNNGHNGGNGDSAAASSALSLPSGGNSNFGFNSASGSPGVAGQSSTPLVNLDLTNELPADELAGFIAAPPESPDNPLYSFDTLAPPADRPIDIHPPEPVPTVLSGAEATNHQPVIASNSEVLAPPSMAAGDSENFYTAAAGSPPADIASNAETPLLKPETPIPSPQPPAQILPESFDFFASESSKWEEPSDTSFSVPQQSPGTSGNYQFFDGSNLPGNPFTELSEPAPELKVEPDTTIAIETAAAPAVGNPVAAEANILPDLPQPLNTPASTVPVDKDGYPDESVKRGTGRPWSVKRSDDTDADKTAQEEDKKPDTPVKQVLKYLEGNIEIAGRTVPKKMAAIAAVMLVFFGLQLFGAIGKMFGGLGKTQDLPIIAGTWDMAFKYNGRIIQSQMEIYQNGNNIEGEGQDGKYFQIRGTYKPPDIEFEKTYVDPVNLKILGKPVLYAGKVKTDYSDRYPTMTGVYEAVIKKGYYYDAKLVKQRDLWDASMTARGKSATAAAASGAATPDVQARKDPKEFHNKLMMIAVGILCVMGGLVFASLKLFGPSGLVNIWSKQEYIPSQFKSQHSKMLRELGKPARPGGLPLGKRDDWNVLKLGQPRELALTPELRDSNPHLLVLGAGAKGKTRFIANLVSHDITGNERAVVVIDSDGTLIDLIIRWMAAHPKGGKFAKRTVIIDPTHKGGCPAYNPLELPDDGDLQAAASAVVFGFKAIYTEPPGSQSQWNQQTANILRNSALLLMANGKTLVDLPTLLSDNDFRDILLDKIEKRKDERVEFITLLETWGQYKRLARTDQWITWVEPILNRVSPMLSDPRIRPILTKPKGDLNLKDLLSQNKILLVKIPQGQLDQNANLLGSLLVTGLKQAALAIGTGTGRRHPCALYLDEFDNFIEKETVDSLTSETKKFQIGMVAAVKTLQHLPEDFRNQIIINVGTLCAFALAKKDGDMLGPQMFRVDGRKIKHQTLSNLFNRVNTSPQFELISDEEKLNIDRVVGQEEKTFFCYRVGTIAGVFHMKSHEFNDIPDKEINWSLIDEMYAAHVKNES